MSILAPNSPRLHLFIVLEGDGAMNRRGSSGELRTKVEMRTGTNCEGV
jgi:hypothetical protein